MNKYIAPALLANASTLGIHWIYDHHFIEELALHEDVLFQVQTKEHYEAATSAYLSYENNSLGDVSVQGNMLRWLYLAMKENPSFSQLDYSKLLYQQFKSGGAYHGYVESYAKKHVLSILAKSLDVEIPAFTVDDDHLVGFMPYLVVKELGLDTKKAWELTQLYSQDEDYYQYFKMFDELLNLLPTHGLKEAIEKVIELGPEKYQTALHKAIEMDDSNAFIDAYSGRACAIKYSIPLVIHIMYHTNSFEEAVRYNSLLGGAISDRNMLLGAFMAQISEIPSIFYDKVGAALTL